MYIDTIAEAELIKITSKIIDNSIDNYWLEEFENKDPEVKKAILDLAVKHKLYYVLNLYCDSGTNLILKGIKIILKKGENVNWAEIVKVADLFQKNNIEYVLVKGVAVSNVLFGNNYIRGVGDIDLVVKENDLDKAFRILRDMGYYREGAKNFSEAIFFWGNKFHEIPMIKDVDGGSIQLELKRGTSCVKDFSLLWSHVTLRTFEETDIYVLDEQFEILHLILNAFMNNESVGVFSNCILRDYFEVAYAVSHNRILWHEILDVAERMEVTHQVAIVLRSVKELYSSLTVEIDKVLRIIQNDYCKYSQRLFYYGDDKIIKNNYGLMDNYPRAKIAYGIYDREFSAYQFLKSYKANLYSKKNPDYCMRSRLHNEEKTEHFIYQNDFGIEASYFFENRNSSFLIVVDVSHKSQNVFDNNRCFIGITWYCNDINSPVFLEKYRSPEIGDLLNLSWNMKADSQIDKQFFSSDEYCSIIDKQEIKHINVTSVQFPENTRFCFEFDKEKMFFPLDVLAFEVKFARALNGDKEMIAIELGTKENFVECVD